MLYIPPNAGSTTDSTYNESIPNDIYRKAMCSFKLYLLILYIFFEIDSR